jgi:uncharacterized membrane protein
MVEAQAATHAETLSDIERRQLAQAFCAEASK